MGIRGSKVEVEPLNRIEVGRVLVQHVPSVPTVSNWKKTDSGFILFPHIGTSPVLKSSSNLIDYTHSFSGAMHVGLHVIPISHKAPYSLYPRWPLQAILARS